MCIILDCCNEEEQGSKDYKGRYTYVRTFAGTFNNISCQYGNGTNVTTRYCRKNLTVGAQWDLPDLSNCAANSSVTRDLIEVNQVSVSAFLFVCLLFFVFIYLFISMMTTVVAIVIIIITPGV